MEKIRWKGYYSSVYQTYQNDRAWLNISPFEWVSLFGRVHWCSALSDLLAFLMRCINPFAKSGNASCNSVWLCVCVWLWACGGEGFLAPLPPPVRLSVRWLSNNGHNPFRNVELESSEDKKDKEDKEGTTTAVLGHFFFLLAIVQTTFRRPTHRHRHSQWLFSKCKIGPIKLKAPVLFYSISALTEGSKSFVETNRWTKFIKENASSNENWQHLINKKDIYTFKITKIYFWHTLKASCFP